jgi:hypothetical protein
MPAPGLLSFKLQASQSVSASISGALPAGDLSLALDGRTWFLYQLDCLVHFDFVRFKSPQTMKSGSFRFRELAFVPRIVFSRTALVGLDELCVDLVGFLV